MDILENVIVGNFLFGFGVKMGIGHGVAPIEPVSVNLLQQTPLDTVLGDVVVGNGRFFRIIEFKRAANNSNKEIGKWRRLSAGLTAESAMDLEKLSRKIHWYVRSDFREDRKDIQVVPYLDFPTMAAPMTLPEFIDLTAKDAVTDGVGEEEMLHCRKYLEVLGLVQGRGGGASGCLLLFANGGGVGFVPAGDTREFLMTPRQLVERAMAQEHALIREVVERVELRQERERQEKVLALRQRGPTMSMKM